jgi:hypothetical protein
MTLAINSQRRAVTRSAFAPYPGLLTLTLVVWALVGGYLVFREYADVVRGFMDSDDATRMTMVRDLLHGQGWYDQRLVRFQPPAGVIMHWSRLLDGALAAVDGTLSRLVGPAQGELLTRVLWPVLLIGPAIAASLTITRRYVVTAAVQAAAMLAAAMICLVCQPLFAQFQPGRIDHHNVQILLWLLAYAGAAGGARRIGGAALAGTAIGLGLAIGLEALVLEAAIAGFMALRFIGEGQERRRLLAFSGGLFVSTGLCFLLQTPPDRWTLSACDALAANLTAGVLVGATGLALASLRASASRQGRAAAVAAAGVAAATVYVGLDPHCLHGPFAEIDPRIHAIWLDGVQEMSSLPQVMRQTPASALTIAAAIVLGGGCWVVTAMSPERRRAPAFWLGGLMLLLSAISAFAMLRMASYVFWAAVPPIATTAALAFQRLSRRGEPDKVRLALIAVLLAPNVSATVLGLGLRLGHHQAAQPMIAGPQDRCFEAASYRSIGALPAGRVLAEPDLGPYLAAYTPSAVIAAPYHRMSAGLIAAHDSFAAGADAARAKLRGLGVDYVVNCPAHAAVTKAPPASLRAALNAGRPPAWLQPVSASTDPLQVYRLRP